MGQRTWVRQRDNYEMKGLRKQRSKIDLPAKVKYNSPDKSKEEIPLV
jgi:hypothetical protein